MSQISDNELRLNRPFVKPDGELQLQLVGFHETHQKDWPKNYQIVAFAIDDKSNSYCLKINDFKPFFYTAIPEAYQKTPKKFLREFKRVGIFNKWRNNTDLLSKLVDDFTLVKYKDFSKYNRSNSWFVKMTFKNSWNYKNVAYYLEKTEIVLNGDEYLLKLFESNIAPFIRFFHEKNINPAGWVKINKYRNEDKALYYSSCQYEMTLSYKDVSPLEHDTIGPLLTASFDIETTSTTGGFPQFIIKGDAVIQIGTTVEMFGKPEYSYRYISTLGECDDIENARVDKCETEEEVITKWLDFMSKLDPDIVTGYNINGFDFEYLYRRAEMYKIDHKFIKLSRIRLAQDQRKIYVEKSLSSSAMGDNLLKYVDMIGRVNIDLLKYVRDTYKDLTSYKLDNVAKRFGFDQGKDDMPYKEIFRIFREGTATEKNAVAKYCIQDCKLCNNLLNKLSVLENCIGMSNTCSVPLQYIFSRGQGIKCHSLVVKECTPLGYLVPVKRKNGSGGFKGATVLAAKAGAHFFPVSALDFASLYPSCILSHNLCPSSKIEESDIQKYKLKYDDYRKIEWTETDKEGNDVHNLHYYIQPKLDEVGEIINDDRAVIPIICQKLLAQRKATRVRQKQVAKTDPFKASVLNGLQLSYKVTANSIYGQLGGPTSPISLPAVAACITTVGRQLLEYAQDIILKNYNKSDIIYGDTDSVFMKFQLKRHKCDCEFHKDNIQVRIDKFYEIKNSITKKMTEDEEEFIHTRGSTAMLNKTDYKIYGPCECPLIEDEMGKEALAESIRLACESGVISSSLLPYPHDLEYEKTYQPYILFTKKRYLGRLYEFDLDNWKLDYKGIALKRRDFCGIVKVLYKQFVDLIMDGKKDEAFDCLKQTLNDLIDNHTLNKYDIGLFTISKGLKALTNYKNIEFFCTTCKKKLTKETCKTCKKPARVTTNLGHVMLAERVKQRDPGNAFQNNDRVPYCFVQTKGDTRRLLQGDRIETPTYIKEKDLKLDYLYYIQRQIQRPVEQLFLHIDNDRSKSIFKAVINRGNLNNKGMKGISEYMTSAPQQQRPSGSSYSSYSRNKFQLPSVLVAKTRAFQAPDSNLPFGLRDKVYKGGVKKELPIEKRPVKELKQLATDKGLSFKSNIKKADLLELIKNGKPTTESTPKPKSKTVKQLKEQAKSMGLVFKSNIKKADLMALIESVPKKVEVVEPPKKIIKKIIIKKIIKKKVVKKVVKKVEPVVSRGINNIALIVGCGFIDSDDEEEVKVVVPKKKKVLKKKKKTKKHKPAVLKGKGDNVSIVGCGFLDSDDEN